MPPFMQIHAVNCARKTHDSLEKFTARTLACTLKREFDGVYGPAWHCIVGDQFWLFCHFCDTFSCLYIIVVTW
ncbi:hypothetical protein LIER_21766 [Lithospermum erythrorhizon]|uniref:Dynein light chain n=1 Tax=Lithospermum erythrorhizon TaxID=34254 RepID=A0AAV3QSM2_LITER